MGIESMLMEQQLISTGDVLQNGIVTGIVKNNWNQDFPGQVQVELLIGKSGQTTLQWVRVMQPYCGKDYGEYFLPEINSEVVIGFLAGNTSSPVVLGCLWGKEEKLPEGKANEKNSIKSIRTKGGHEIIFDETEGKELIEIKTKGQLDILLQDEEKVITIQDDQGKNLLKIEGQNGAITIEAEKKLLLKAGEETITLDAEGKKMSFASGNVEIQANQGLKLKGQNTNLEGNMMNIKAQGSMKVESSAALQLKGSICQIN